MSSWKFSAAIKSPRGFPVLEKPRKLDTLGGQVFSHAGEELALLYARRIQLAVLLALTHPVGYCKRRDVEAHECKKVQEIAADVLRAVLVPYHHNAGDFVPYEPVVENRILVLDAVQP